MNFAVYLIFVLVLLLTGCDIRTVEPNPVSQRHTNRCTSKQSGSTPSCWNEADWKAFCERVQCKDLSQTTTTTGDYMKKGFYWIIIGKEDDSGRIVNVPDLSEGSFEYHGKLMVHRNKDYRGNPYQWRVSHTDSGACMVQRRTLKEARRIAKETMDFAIWNVRGYDELKAAIKDPANEEQVERIKAIANVV